MLWSSSAGVHASSCVLAGTAPGQALDCGLLRRQLPAPTWVLTLPLAGCSSAPKAPTHQTPTATSAARPSGRRRETLTDASNTLISAAVGNHSYYVNGEFQSIRPELQPGTMRVREAAMSEAYQDFPSTGAPPGLSHKPACRSEPSTNSPNPHPVAIIAETLGFSPGEPAGLRTDDVCESAHHCPVTGVQALGPASGVKMFQ
jgi:hypothetical protein